MTTPRLLLALALLAALAACEIGGRETRSGASAACLNPGGACATNADCCSYGCQAGVCVPNPAQGGACRTTSDCLGGRLCKSGACATLAAGACRDDADVCSAWSQCCSGNCEGGVCTQNRPPVVDAGPADVAGVPYTKPYTLQNASADPDGDPLVFGWSFVSVPAGSGATLSSTTAASPTFTPDRTGDYVLRLVVTDGPVGAPNRLTVETTVSLHVVNRAPEPVATAQATSWSRNVPLRITATAADPDGDALECAWQVTEPGAAQPTLLADFAACANPSSSSLDYTPAGEGTYVVEHVVRDRDRTSGAIVHAVAAAATFVSQNDPPTPAVTRTPAYYANMGATAGTTPTVTLDASPSTDRNGDHLAAPGLSYAWTVVSASDGGALPALAGADTATPSFVPPREADYLLRVTVGDPAQFGRPAATAALDVPVRVGRYVQPLGHTVADAARAGTSDTIVLAGRDPADTTKGMVWAYDLSTGTEATGVRLVDPADGASSGIPWLVDVTSDGSRAVVVDEGVSIWIVTFGGTPSTARLTRPFAIGHLVVAGNRYAYLFGTPGSSSTVRELDLQNSTLSTPAGWAGYGAFGAAYGSGTANYLYRADDVFHDWYRYAVNNAGAASSYAASASGPTCGSSYPASYATAIWATRNSTFSNAYVVSSCGAVYRADTLVSLGTLGVAPWHVDSTSAGAILACQGGSLSRFSATLQAEGTDVLPWWSQDGYARTTSAWKAFFGADGSKRFAVVHDGASPVRYGVVTFP